MYDSYTADFILNAFRKEKISYHRDSPGGFFNFRNLEGKPLNFPRPRGVMGVQTPQLLSRRMGKWSGVFSTSCFQGSLQCRGSEGIRGGTLDARLGHRCFSFKIKAVHIDVSYDPGLRIHDEYLWSFFYVNSLTRRTVFPPSNSQQFLLAHCEDGNRAWERNLIGCHES